MCTRTTDAQRKTDAVKKIWIPEEKYKSIKKKKLKGKVRINREKQMYKRNVICKEKLTNVQKNVIDKETFKCTNVTPLCRETKFFFQKKYNVQNNLQILEVIDVQLAPLLP